MKENESANATIIIKKKHLGPTKTFQSRLFLLLINFLSIKEASLCMHRSDRTNVSGELFTSF